VALVFVASMDAIADANDDDDDDDDAIAASIASSSGSSISVDDLATTVRVLKALASADGGPTAEYREPRFKPLREAIQLYVDDVRARLFHGQGADKYTRRKENKRRLDAKAQQERAMDRAAAEKTQMRAERLRMLADLERQGGAAALMLVPDGAVADGDGVAFRASLAALTHEAHDSSGADAAAADEAGAGAAAAHGETELRMLRACYACKVRFKVLHHFYAQLCPECAALNFAKRNQTASLSGRVFLVTGARVKIGFHVVLKLLRCGATVLATSRFPADTAARYAAQPDASSWIDRLRIYGLDMRDLSSLELFCRHLIGTCHRLDGIVNNACQTIRRPAAYYAHLMPLELQPGTWNPEVRHLLADHVSCFGAPAMPPPAAESRDAPAARLLPPSSAPMADATTTMPPTSMPTTVSEAPPAAAAAAAVAALWSAPATGLAAAAATIPSALWSQAPLWSAEPGVPQPDEGTASQFPLGVVDVNGQQLDTRTTNSWLLKLHEVSTPEVAEVLAIHALAPFILRSHFEHASAHHGARLSPQVLAINALAPFILNSRLRGLLEATPDRPAFVVNVSAMEGKFYRYKTPNHPHTNTLFADDTLDCL